VRGHHIGAYVAGRGAALAPRRELAARAARVRASSEAPGPRTPGIRHGSEHDLFALLSPTQRR